MLASLLDGRQCKTVRTKLSSLNACEERNNFHIRNTGLTLIQLLNLIISFHSKLSNDPYCGYLDTQEIKRLFKVPHWESLLHQGVVTFTFVGYQVDARVVIMF